MDIQAALRDGYSKDEVMAELGKRTGMNYQQALADGHSPDDVLAEMSKRTTSTAKTPATAQYDPSTGLEVAPEKPGFMSNVIEAGKKRAGNISNPKPSDMRRVSPILGSALNVAGQTGAFLGDIFTEGVKATPSWIIPKVPGILSEPAGMIAQSLQGNPIVKAAKEGWGMLSEGSRNDIGNIANAFMIPPGVSAAKGMGKLGMEGVNIGRDVAGILAPGGIMSKVISEGAPARMLESGAKWSTTLSPAARKRVSQTLLKEKIVLNEKGYGKLEATVDDINKQIKGALEPYNDIPINADNVVTRTSEARKKANGAYDRKEQLAKVDEEVASFLDNWGDNLTVGDAQTIKQDIYKQLKSHYDSLAKGGIGKYTDGEIAAKKNIAKGLKEEIEKAAADAPIKALNARESDLLNLEPHLRRAVGRVGNHNILSLDDVLAAGVGAALGSSSVGMLAGAAKKIMSPAMKSRLAIKLDDLRSPGTVQPGMRSATGQALEGYLGDMNGLLQPEAMAAGSGRLGPIPSGANATMQVGPVRSGTLRGEAYGPQPQERPPLGAGRLLPPGQGFELPASDVIDASFTSRERPVMRLPEGDPQKLLPLRSGGEGFEMRDAAGAADFLRADGQPFASQSSILMAMKRAAMNPQTTDIVKVEGGYLGRPRIYPGKEFRPADVPKAPVNPWSMENVNRARAAQTSEKQPLIEEARKYKSADDFENAVTQNDLMDLSNPQLHRIGRIFSDSGNGIQDLIAINKIYSKDLPSYPTANVPRVSNPETTVTVYRSAHAEAKGIEAGDYVSFSKDYANSHDRGQLISKKVPAKDVIWQGNDFNEWVYSPNSIRAQYPEGLTDIWKKAQETRPATKPKAPVNPDNIIGRINQGGGMDLGADYNVKIMREFPDTARVHKKGAMQPDDWADILRDEGYTGFTDGDSLVEALKSGEGRGILNPAKQDDIIARNARRETDEWARRQVETLEDIDARAIIESKGDIQSGLIDEIAANGLSIHDKEAALRELENLIDARMKPGKATARKQGTSPNPKGTRADVPF